MKFIVGLGNPGKQYEQTRHNTGFALLDALAGQWGAGFQEKSKFKALIAETTLKDEKVLLIKPTTFYNLVGESVRAIRDFYKCENSDILAIHDDMALPFGTIRTRLSGSDAGNNGIKSLNQHLGQDYARIRVGIWSDHRERIPATDFVLSTFTKKEQEALTTDLLPHIKTFALEHIEGELSVHTVTLPAD